MNRTISIWFGLAALLAGLVLDSIWLDIAGVMALTCLDDDGSLPRNPDLP